MSRTSGGWTEALLAAAFLLLALAGAAGLFGRELGSSRVAGTADGGAAAGGGAVAGTAAAGSTAAEKLR